MIDNYLIVLIVFVFILSFISVKFWISRAVAAEICGKDVHKKDSRKVAEIGGLPVLFSFLVGVLAFVAIRVFSFGSSTGIEVIFAILLCVMIAGIIGVVDDILGWKIGLRQWQKPVLTFLAALPIMVIDAGVRVMHFPIFGAVDLGIFYLLLVVPLFVIVAANASNMIAGYNGLESGLSMIMAACLGILSWKSGQGIYALLCLLFFVCVFAFWLFNKYPAKIFPGDSFTYASGAFLAAIAIFADLEKILVILLVPYAIEFFLKLRGKFKKESFGKVVLEQDEGESLKLSKLDLRYEKFYGLEHVMIYIWKKFFGYVSEKRVVYSLYFVQLVFFGIAMIV